MGIRQFLQKSQKGQGTVEYALIVIAVVAIIIAVLFAKSNPFGTAINTAFNKMSNTVTTANTNLT